MLNKSLQKLSSRSYLFADPHLVVAHGNLHLVAGRRPALEPLELGYPRHDAQILHVGRGRHVPCVHDRADAELLAAAERHVQVVDPVLGGGRHVRISGHGSALHLDQLGRRKSVVPIGLKKITEKRC